MAENVGERLNAISDKNDSVQLRFLLEALIDENTALRAAFTGLTAKLDADAGVTDTDYAATLDPAAATITK